MSETAHLSDRMPDVAHDRASWSAEELRHLASCAECGAEWELVRRGRRLGTEISRDLDPELIARRVLTRLEAIPPTSVIRFPRLRWLVLVGAAAAAILAVLIRPVGPRDGGDTAPIVSQALLPELEGLSAEELELLFEVLPSADTDPESGIPDLDELTEDELRSVLRSLEG